jgi:hypothetical protein
MEFLKNPPEDLQFKQTFQSSVLSPSVEVRDYLARENLYFIARQADTTDFTSAEITSDKIVVSISGLGERFV